MLSKSPPGVNQRHDENRPCTVIKSDRGYLLRAGRKPSLRGHLSSKKDLCDVSSDGVEKGAGSRGRGREWG